MPNKNFILLFNGTIRAKVIALSFLLINLLFAQNLSAQQMNVSGRITNASGEPVSNASVSVRGSNNGTTSDANGNYSITVAKNATLVFSGVGLVSSSVTVGNEAVINVSLTLDNKSMDEVVVVGYGTQQKRNVTGSIVSIGGNALREVPSPNISQALQGRLAGVDISQTSTRPGATMQIRIRGTRSLSADNNPLIILDGIPFIGSLAEINPNDIKNIEVLKDASATAIYGSRGANGVIIVTTEKGTKNRKPRINYSSYIGNQEVFAKYPMMNGPQFVALRAARPVAAGGYLNGIDEKDSINTDWQDLFYKTGIVTDHNVSLLGGTETGSYSFGFGYHLNKGVVPTQDYKRYSLRGSIDQNIGKHFRVGVTTNTILNESNGNQVGLYNTLSMSPIASPYNPDGSLRRNIRMAADEQFVLTKSVIDSLAENDKWINKTSTFATYNALYGEVKAPFLEGLKYRFNLGLDYRHSHSGTYTGQGVNNVNPLSLSNASVDNQRTFHWTIENILTYDKVFAQKHSVNVTGLYSNEQNTFDRSNMSALDIPVDAFTYYNIGQANGQITVAPGNQNYTQWGLSSFMGRVQYAYDSKYLLSVAVRSDGSSRLATGNKWFTYPAVSVGWNISEESFMSGISWLDNLKLRAGFGETSNQAITPYSTLGSLATAPYNFGATNYATGYAVSQLPNPKLGWEFSKTINLGVDFSLFKNRLSGSIEYYKTKTEDILLGLGLPPTSGVNSYTANIGATENKGVEIGLNGTIIKSASGFTWDLGVNFYANDNKLVSLASGQTRDEGNWWFVGYNINSIFDYQKVGLWRDSKDALDNHLNVLEPGGTVGMIKVLYTGDYDANGVPVRAIGPADRQILEVDPKWQGGFNTRLSYKGFDLSTVGFFRNGGLIFSTIHGSNGYLNLLTGRRNNINVDYWTPTNLDAKYPNPAGPISNDNPKYGSTLSYFDGSFLKIRTITLGYDFNHKLLKNGDTRLRAYFTAQNPFVFFSPFHDESGLDPESNSFGNENAAVNLNQNYRRILTVGFNTPSTRNYILGINLTF
ncbi:MAG: TonB-dependent receptor [Chitinophagaceae bacterium]|nr:MAG: TonB-dependent receptor [Chitinophagaceae bacterium]